MNRKFECENSYKGFKWDGLHIKSAPIPKINYMSCSAWQKEGIIPYRIMDIEKLSNLGPSLGPSCIDVNGIIADNSLKMIAPKSFNNKTHLRSVDVSYNKIKVRSINR